MSSRETRQSLFHIKRDTTPQRVLTDLQQSAVLESEAAANPGAPLLVDVTKAPNQFGLRPPQVEVLQQQIIQGSGREIRIDPATGAETVLFEASTLERAVGVVKSAGTLALNGLAVAGSGLSGYQVGTGIDKMLDPLTRAEGAVDVGQGTANLALSIGVPVAVKMGAIVTEAGTIVGATAAAAGLAAGASVGLAAETVRAAVRGQDSPIDVMDRAYGTHVGDIYGWVTGVYRKH